MSGKDLIDAARSGNFREVVRLVDKKHVKVNFRDKDVSFPFLKRNLNHLFIFFLCYANRINTQLS